MMYIRKFAVVAVIAFALSSIVPLVTGRQPAAAQAVDSTTTPMDNTLSATQAATLAAISTTKPSGSATINASSSGTAIYTVQPGENLFRIGLKFGLSVDALAQANGIINPNLVLPGQKIIIPGVSPTNPLLNPLTATITPISASSATAIPAPHLTYTVQAGDNLFRIALKFNVPYAVLAQLNNLTNLNLVYIGQTLKLPAGATLATPTNTPFPPAAATAAATVSQIMAATSAATSAVADNNGGTPGSGVSSIAEVNTPVQIITLAPTAAIIVPPTIIITLAPSAVPPTDSPIPPTATITLTATTTLTSTTIPPTASSTATLTATATNQPLGFAMGVTVNPAGDPVAVAGQVTELGASWVQYTASWKSIELTRGSPDFRTLDMVINAYAAAKLNVLLTLANAPDWARSVTAENGPPTDPALFATFASATASRYKGKVRAYEIWTEPNLRRNWNGSSLSAAAYVDLLRRANSAIKAADSAALVVSAGLAPTGFYDGVNAINDRVFLKQAYAAGLATAADAIGAHPSGWANPPDATCCQASPGVSGWFNDRSFYFHDTLTDYRQVMKDSNDSAKLIWVTAFGWGANDGVATSDSVNTPSFGFVKWTSQALQAQYVLRGFEIGKTLGYVGPMFVYNLNACQAGLAPDDALFYPCYYSLLDASGNPRPAYVALMAVKQK